MHIALLEDDPDIAECVQAILSMQGHSSSLFREAQTCIDTLLTHRETYHALISDIMLSGGKDGIKAICEIRAAQPELPIMIVSADDVSNVPLFNIPRLRKPFKLKDFLATLETILSPLYSIITAKS